MTEKPDESGVEVSTSGSISDVKRSTQAEITERASSNIEDDISFHELEENAKLFQFMTGIKEDLQARVPLYKSDWGRPQSIYTVVNATFFAFVIQLIPALVFAELMNHETQNNLATAETLLSSAIIGIIYAIFAGQPLVIMGITGPVAILLGTSYGLTEKFDAEYFPFFFWICIWAGLMHILSAMVGLVSLVWKVTPFTSQIFELFIGTNKMYKFFVCLSCNAHLLHPLCVSFQPLHSSMRPLKI